MLQSFDGFSIIPTRKYCIPTRKCIDKQNLYTELLFETGHFKRFVLSHAQKPIRDIKTE